MNVSDSLPDNTPCLVCKHVHYMMVLEYLYEGGFRIEHHQCSELICKCQAPIFDNLEYLEYLNEEKEREEAALPSVS